MEIKRGILQAFDSGTYLATVAMTGSLSVWLEGLPVSRAIASGEHGGGPQRRRPLLRRLQPQRRRRLRRLDLAEGTRSPSVVAALYNGRNAMTDERILSSRSGGDDDAIEVTLRPQRLDEYIGQARIKDNLGIAIAAARKRGEPLDHVLLYGPPGLGKTTLATVIAHEMGVQARITSGPAIERPGDLAAILTNLEAGDVLFIDEIHRLSRAVEEILYPAMEDFALDLVIGKGPGARSVRLNLPRFTLVGATTRYAMMSPPLRDRFGSVYRLDYYDARRPGGDRAALRRRARRAHRGGRRERDRPALARHAPRRQPPPAPRARLRRGDDRRRDQRRRAPEAALGRLDIDEKGLDEVDLKILRAIIEKFRGGPVGIDTIAASISEEADTIEDVYEPYLLQLGFLERTPQGRKATRAAYEHLGITPPSSKDSSGGQRSLFE